MTARLLVLGITVFALFVDETSAQLPTPASLARPDISSYTESKPIHIGSADGDRLIENRIIRPKAGEYAIRIDNHTRGKIVIRDCLFIGPNGTAKDGLDSGNGGGVLAWQSSDVEVSDCYFEAIEGFCVRIMGSRTRNAKNIRITGNRMVDLQAYYEKGTTWGWQADGIQFVRVSGANNSIRDNLCLNRPGVSYLTDFINVYCSSGTKESPLLVEGNALIGAGADGLYNQYGCGIQLNDHSQDEDGGEYVTALDNLLIDPGIVGININGGYVAKVVGNRVLMSPKHRTNLREQPEVEHPTWAGITLFNYSGGISRDGGHIVRENAVEFRGGVGAGFINQTTPPDTIIQNNNWQARLDWTVLVEGRLKREQ